MENKNVLKIFDTTLRDGEQTPGVNLNLHEKLQIARQLERLGVDVIEAGFAAASPGDFEAVEGVAGAMQNTCVCSLARTVKNDIERAAKALEKAKRPRIHVFIATSALHLKHKLNMTEQQVFDNAVEGVWYARKFVDEVEFSAEDATRTDIEFLHRIVEAVIEAGAGVVNIPDTVGYAMPREYFDLIDGIRQSVPNIGRAVLSVHCHDDLGLAVANSTAALRAGAAQVECTVNGIGERAGNASMEEIIMCVDTRGEYFHMTHDIRTEQIMRTSRLVSSLTGVDVPPNKAIVGDNAFLHESGIHQHGVLNDPSTYEVMRPERIGAAATGIVLGKLSGKHAFEKTLRDMGYTLDEAGVKEAFERFKALADRKKSVSEKDIEALLEEKRFEIPQVYDLAEFQVVSGNTGTGTATVKLLARGEERVEAAVGDGPVDASFNAIDKLTGLDVELTSYGIKAVTGGRDALGEVTVRVRHKDEEYLGKGISTDIIESSIKAYLQAVNRIISES